MELPEEKLLDLISKKGTLLSQNFFQTKNFFWKLLRKAERKTRRFFYPLFSLRGMYAFLFLAAAFLLFNLILPLLPLAKQVKFANVKTYTFDLSKDALDSRSFEDYLRQIKGKSIFGRATSAQASGLEPEEILKNIALIGIIFEDEPLALMKDKKTENLYYLKEGESIGEVEIIKVMEDKIIVELRGERFEIHL